jgi:predicted homoserine dehydrogenase-like protein
MKNIGVIGTGFIARGLVNLISEHNKYRLSAILTRTDPLARATFPRAELLTNSLENLIVNSDLIIECSGDAIYATDSIAQILEAKLPVVTMNSEYHVTAGSYFIDKGLVTEAEGDQPGSLAILNEDVIAMGFKPLVYGNIKGFLNHNPSEEDMKFWGNKSGISLDMVTSFTDGTKVQIEQAFVANGLNANIAKDGLVGLEEDDMMLGGAALAEYSKKLDEPISDYLLSPKLPAGVFIVAEHDGVQQEHLKYYKMGDGPYYVMERTFHLCHLEIMKTVKRVFNGGGVLLDNSKNPTISVATIAKRDIKKGTVVKKGIGSFEVRGEAIRISENKKHLPIGLCANVVLKRDIKAGEVLNLEDVEMEESLALHAWKSIIENNG